MSNITAVQRERLTPEALSGLSDRFGLVVRVIQIFSSFPEPQVMTEIHLFWREEWRLKIVNLFICHLTYRSILAKGRVPEFSQTIDRWQSLPEDTAFLDTWFQEGPEGWLSSAHPYVILSRQGDKPAGWVGHDDLLLLADLARIQADLARWNSPPYAGGLQALSTFLNAQQQRLRDTQGWLTQERQRLLALDLLNHGLFGKPPG